jgi:hypothetical protein
MHVTLVQPNAESVLESLTEPITDPDDLAD